MAWPVRKNWPFKDGFDKALQKVFEGGFMENFMQEFLRGNFGGDHPDAWRVMNDIAVCFKQHTGIVMPNGELKFEHKNF